MEVLRGDAVKRSGQARRQNLSVDGPFVKFTDKKGGIIMKQKLRRYIGDRHFYRMLLGIVVPIIIQNGITNFVSLLDNPF